MRLIPSHESGWVRANFSIVDNVIKERPSSTYKSFDPFDYYYKDGTKKSLYIEFAGLDETNEKAITRFVNKYGILGLEFRKNGRDFHCLFKERVHKILERDENFTKPQAPGESDLDYAKRRENIQFSCLKRWLAAKWPDQFKGVEEKAAIEEFSRALDEVILDNQGLRITENIDEFASEIRLMRSLIRANAAIIDDDIQAMLAALAGILDKAHHDTMDKLDLLSKRLMATAEHLLEYKTQSVHVPAHVDRADREDVAKKTFGVHVKGRLTQLVTALCDIELRRAYPKLADGSSEDAEQAHAFEVAWHSKDLLSAMYIMFVLDITSGHSPRI